MKRIYLVLLVAFFGGHVMAQTIAKTKEVKGNSIVSVSNPSNTTGVKQTTSDLKSLPGFPVYVNTGNKEVDDANYETAKGNWIQENKATYDQYVSNLSGSTNKTFVSKQTFGDASEERRSYILAHPELFVVE